MYRYARRVRAAIDWDEIYEGGVCPDCGESIPKNTPQGGECENCGHVFWKEEYTREQALPRESSQSARRAALSFEKIKQRVKEIDMNFVELLRLIEERGDQDMKLYAKDVDKLLGALMAELGE